MWQLVLAGQAAEEPQPLRIGAAAPGVHLLAAAGERGEREEHRRVADCQRGAGRDLALGAGGFHAPAAGVGHRRRACEQHRGDRDRGRESRTGASSAHAHQFSSIARPAASQAEKGTRQVLSPTVEFAIFFPIVLALSWALMPRQHWWKPFIVVASYVFYAAVDPRFCLLLAAIPLVSQLAVIAIHRTEDERLRKWFTAGGVVFDLGILAVFKYYGFFVSDVSGTLNSLGLVTA